MSCPWVAADRTYRTELLSPNTTPTKQLEISTLTSARCRDTTTPSWTCDRFSFSTRYLSLRSNDIHRIALVWGVAIAGAAIAVNAQNLIPTTPYYGEQELNLTIER